MPFALVIIGALFVLVAIRGTHNQAIDLLRGEFSGQGNFLAFVASLGVVGAAGYVPYLQTLSRAFMGLILLALMLGNEGFFAQFNRQVLNRPRQANPTTPSGGSLPAGQMQMPQAPSAPSAPSSPMSAPSGPLYS